MTREEAIGSIVSQIAEDIYQWAMRGLMDEIENYVRPTSGIDDLTDEEIREQYSSYLPEEPDEYWEDLHAGVLDEQVCPSCGEPTDDQDDYSWWSCGECEITWQGGGDA